MPTKEGKIIQWNSGKLDYQFINKSPKNIVYLDEAIIIQFLDKDSFKVLETEFGMGECVRENTMLVHRGSVVCEGGDYSRIKGVSVQQRQN